MGLVGRSALASAGEDLTHALMHWSESVHQHHADGSLGLDGSDEDIAHLLADNALTAPALCLAPEKGLGTVSMPKPGDAAAVSLPEPFPDRLRRPPRLTG
jgi:hypothetical protein